MSLIKEDSKSLKYNKLKRNFFKEKIVNLMS